MGYSWGYYIRVPFLWREVVSGRSRFWLIDNQAFLVEIMRLCSPADAS